MRDRASGSTVRVCRACAKRRRRVVRWALIAIALVGGAVVVGYALTAPADDVARERPAAKARRAADPGVEAFATPLGGVRYVPKITSAWLLARLNTERNRAKRPRLRRDRAASLLAQEHTMRMAKAQRLSHVPARDLRPFRDSGNVSQTQYHYRGGSVTTSAEQVFRKLVVRRQGRQPALSRAYNRVGVGVTRRRGNLWVSLIFISV